MVVWTWQRRGSRWIRQNWQACVMWTLYVRFLLMGVSYQNYLHWEQTLLVCISVHVSFITLESHHFVPTHSHFILELKFVYNYSSPKFMLIICIPIIVSSYFVPTSLLSPCSKWAVRFCYFATTISFCDSPQLEAEWDSKPLCVSWLSRLHLDK